MRAGWVMLCSVGLYLAMMVALVFPAVQSLANRYPHGYALVVELMITLVPLAIFMALWRLPVRTIFGRKPRVGSVFLAAGIAVSAYYVIVVMQVVWYGILAALGGETQVASLPAVENPLDMALAVFSVGVVAAVCEEALIRGMLLPALSGTMRRWWALVVTSALFACMHGSIEALPYTFVLGMLMGYFAWRTASIWPGIAFHFVNNLIAVVLSVVSQRAVTTAAPDASAALDELSNVVVYGVLGVTAIFPLIVTVGLLVIFHRITRNTEPLMPVPRETRAHAWLPLGFAGLGLLMLVGLAAMVTLLVPALQRIVGG